MAPWMISIAQILYKHCLCRHLVDPVKHKELSLLHVCYKQSSWPAKRDDPCCFSCTPTFSSTQIWCGLLLCRQSTLSQCLLVQQRCILRRCFCLSRCTKRRMFRIMGPSYFLNFFCVVRRDMAPDLGLSMWCSSALNRLPHNLKGRQLKCLHQNMEW